VTTKAKIKTQAHPAPGDALARKIAQIVAVRPGERDTRMDGFNAGVASADPVPVSNVRTEDDAIIGGDLLLRITVPNEGLRTYLAYTLSELASETDDLELGASDIFDLNYHSTIGCYLPRQWPPCALVWCY